MTFFPTSECQRQAIFADPAWENGYYDCNNPPYRGLEVARQIAMISYRTSNSYTTKFGRRISGGVESTKIEDRTVSDQWQQGSLEAQWKGEKQTMESFEVRYRQMPAVYNSSIALHAAGH